MKEREINFKVNDDLTLVVDENGDLAKKLKKIYNELTLNLGFCYEQLTKGELTEGMKETHLYLAEHYMIDFLKEVNYDSILAKRSEERHKEIRSLNDENRELRKQLGDKVTNEDAREKMKNINDSFKKWWNIYGFGHTSELYFSSYGNVCVKLSGRITDSYYSEERISEEEKIDILKKAGFTIIDDESEVLASEKNMKLIKTLLQNKYPSAEIIKFSTDCRREKERFRDIEISISNLNDFID